MHNRQQVYRFEGQVTRNVHFPYLLYLPRKYDTSQRWPLVLFLHGAGERGNNPEVLKQYGIPRLINEGQEFPFIVVSPQCPGHENWVGNPEGLAALLDEIEDNYAVDSDRIYVTGLSMGGFGTWMLAIANPQRFAAIAPICGGGDAANVCAISHLPVWAFHGAKDRVVPLQQSQEMVEKLNACGGNARLTIYPDADHDSWTQTYANRQLYIWLLEHCKGAEDKTER